ncbi:MAG: aminoglycoside phosphotransferase family protein [Gammaproteobacteria bacterium]|nr:aminoglycoside phosphotransferase family protein [Gammaproteobacteria bacterium]NNF61565.1 aminoglycoside phosphotransferase family protein [Gammaproteobacteria bacterium]
MSAAQIPAQVLRRWHRLDGATVTPIESGLINRTYLLDTGKQRYILQRLHPVFESTVNRDIDAVTRHLQTKGLVTPKLIRCDDEALSCEAADGVWRLLDYIRGQTAHAISGKKMASEAGRMAAQYHTALSDFDYEYRYSRGHVHDTPAHLEKLRATLKSHSDHRLHAEVAPLAENVLQTTERFTDIDKLPLRHCHGDLKVSNVLFDNDWHAICLVDLDTVNRMAWPLEMGDALRSWCNPRTEDQLAARLDLGILEAVMSGYAGAAPEWLTDAEKNALVSGLARICLELSARFLTDALRECYFGWDAETYATCGEHNLARGRAMAALYIDVMQKKQAANRIVTSCLG